MVKEERAEPRIPTSCDVAPVELALLATMYHYYHVSIASAFDVVLQGKGKVPAYCFSI